MKTKTNKIGFLYWRISLLCVIIGIFLLPQLAFLFSITDENIINITNKERIKENLNPLTANQLLGKAAYDKAQAIMNSQRFGHNIIGEKFSHWIKESGYQYSYIGENLAVDFYTNEGIIKAWLKSPTHRKNILNEKFSEIGVAVVSGNLDGKETTLVVQIFGSPLVLPDPGHIAAPKSGESQITFLPPTATHTFTALSSNQELNTNYQLPKNSYYGYLTAAKTNINKIMVKNDFLALNLISEYSIYLFLFLLLILASFYLILNLNTRKHFIPHH